MGDGFAVRPRSNDIYAPVDGEVVMVAGTKHALGIKSKDGLEVLVHMGIDTVALEGQGFGLFVKEGDKVTKDDKIAIMDVDFIKENGKDTDVLVIITNSETITGLDLVNEKEAKARQAVGAVNIK